MDVLQMIDWLADRKLEREGFAIHPWVTYARKENDV